MPKDTRPQLFQAYDALKGFRELLKEQERIIVPKRELSEDDLEQLDYKIHQVKEGMIIKVIYFNKGQYIQIEGLVSKINLDTKLLQIVKNRINITDIIDIDLD